MPVRFPCRYCQTRLSISRRKIGVEIRCPKCGAPMQVPDEGEAQARLALVEVAREEHQVGEAAPQADVWQEFAVYDKPPAAGPEPPPPVEEPASSPPARSPHPSPGQPPSRHHKDPSKETNGKAQRHSPRVREHPPDDRNQALGRRRRKDDDKEPKDRRDEKRSKADAGNRSRRARNEPRPAPPPPPPTTLPPPAEPPRKTAPPTPRPIVRSADARLLLVSRRVMYLQAGLFLAVALLFLAAGFLIGRGVGPIESAAEDAAAPAGEPVLLQGTISYDNAQGRATPDAGAVVLLLPENLIAEPRLPPQSLSPLAQGEPDRRVILQIEELNGAYARADADGRYSLVAPRPGTFQVLFVSRGARRATDQEIDIRTLFALRRVFQPAPALVGDQKYVLATHTLAGGSVNLPHDFGRSGQ